MANKKCPKCGEDNPAEAVMCWACYTPLTAGGGAAMGAGPGLGGGGTATLPRPGTAVGVPGVEAAAKKEIDPKLFFVGGGLLLAAVIALFTTGIIGGSSNTPYVDPSAPSDTGAVSSGFNSDRGAVGPIQSAPPAAPPSPPSAPTGNDNVAPPPPSFSMVVSPNPRFATAAFAIAPAQPGVTPDQAANLARQARQQMAANGRWTKTQIVVFNTADSGQSFRQFMSQRRGAPLSGSDFLTLSNQGVWDNAVIFYETQGKSEKVSQPSKNPKGWWGR
ncbi:hypothetical protein EON83_23315 [bacterium]|nr:MAG: hypothetical protein EON83_23315 [bacterium]